MVTSVIDFMEIGKEHYKNPKKMTDKELYDFGRLVFYDNVKSFTSPVFEDIIDSNGKYVWDCYNADFCKIKNKRNFKFHCLMGACGPRCNDEKKISIRENAILNGFSFSND